MALYSIGDTDDYELDIATANSNTGGQSHSQQFCSLTLFLHLFIVF